MCDVQMKPQDPRTDWAPELRQAANGAVTSRPGRASRRGKCTDLVVPQRSSTQTGYPLHFDKSAGILVVSKRKGKPMSSDRMELPQGTLDLLILKAVALEPQHGWAISARLHQISSASLQIRHCSLYPALHRLERRGWIKARWGTSENNRRAKYYELTRRGRTELETQTTAWNKLAATVGQVLKTV